ncbi:hypothetical protein B0H13DRAFT_1924383 [Mycena leptocephala]|nr:hypothetical protein B0H13DRAFT_1924383 [Mycena leptocephala]
MTNERPDNEPAASEGHYIAVAHSMVETSAQLVTGGSGRKSIRTTSEVPAWDAAFGLNENATTLPKGKSRLFMNLLGVASTQIQMVFYRKNMGAESYKWLTLAGNLARGYPQSTTCLWGPTTRKGQALRQSRLPDCRGAQPKLSSRCCHTQGSPGQVLKPNCQH